MKYLHKPKNSEKSYHIIQPAGIGDIIFCQKIAKTYSKKGKIYWPVVDSIKGIKDYIICPGLEDIPEPTIPINNYFLIQLDGIDRRFPGMSVLKAKYKYIDLDWTDWKDYVTFKRNKRKENKLRKHLGIEEGEVFILICDTVGTPPNTRFVPIIPVGTPIKKVIRMQPIEGFSVFDWCGILEDAKEIYSVDTCIQYITEFLELKATRLELFSRFNPANYMHIEGLFKKPWVYNTEYAIN
jgi:hypothetical protein